MYIGTIIYYCSLGDAVIRLTCTRMSTSSQAASYDLESSVQREFGLATIDRLDIPKGSTILDLGCRTGGLTNVLAEKVGA